MSLRTAPVQGRRYSDLCGRGSCILSREVLAASCGLPRSLRTLSPCSAPIVAVGATRLSLTGTVMGGLTGERPRFGSVWAFGL